MATYPSNPSLSQGTNETAVNPTNWNTLIDNINAIGADLVKLRFFAGLTMSEAADALGLPLRSAERTWTYARTWLHRELEEPAI